LQGVTRSGLDGIDVDVLGGKFNMTDIAAAIGLGQMKHLAEFNAKRKELAQYYFEQFGPDFEAQTGRIAGRRFHQLQLAHVPYCAARTCEPRGLHAANAG
jgi:dTDP-4-amino-4,6-dideoxygalactose transaminase